MIPPYATRFPSSMCNGDIVPAVPPGGSMIVLKVDTEISDVSSGKTLQGNPQEISSKSPRSIRETSEKPPRNSQETPRKLPRYLQETRGKAARIGRPVRGFARRNRKAVCRYGDDTGDEVARPTGIGASVLRFACLRCAPCAHPAHDDGVRAQSPRRDGRAWAGGVVPESLKHA